MPKTGGTSSYGASSGHERGRSPRHARRGRFTKPYDYGGKNVPSPSAEALKRIHAAWDDLACPICMEIPHNAVLLVCEQHERGCQPFMCDTSHRHSNCLDQYRKTQKAEQAAIATAGDTSGPSPGRNGHVFVVRGHEGQDRVDVLRGSLEEVLRGPPGSLQFAPQSGLIVMEGNIERSGDDNVEPSHQRQEGNRSESGVEEGNHVPDEAGLREQDAERQGSGPSPSDVVADNTALPLTTNSSEVRAGVACLVDKVKILGNFTQAESGLACPLCRSRVLGWKVAKDVRTYLNLKERTCSREGCSFTGTYVSLRSHAREVHPLVRPQEADPNRVAEWRRLQHQQDREDVMSTIMALMPGARVYGDYLVEDDVDLDMDHIDESDSDDIGSPDLDLILPMLEVMRGLAVAGPGHQQGGRLPWSFGLGPRPVRRRAFAGRNRPRLGPSFSASLPPPVNLQADRDEPPPFPELPPVPLGGLMPNGDDVVVRRSRWGEIADWRERPAVNPGGPDVAVPGGPAGNPETWTPGALTGLSRDLFDRRRRMFAEAIRERLRRGRDGGAERQDLLD